MKFYFDDKALNLSSQIQEIKDIRSIQQLENFYKVGNAQFAYTTEYSEQGVYLIEVSKLSHQWTGGPFFNSFNTIKHIPTHVIDAAKQNKIRIVILSVVEGDAYIKEHWDGFRALTDSIKLRELPKFSVLVVTANLKAHDQYLSWCKSNNEELYIEFIDGSEGPTSFPSNTSCIANINARDKLPNAYAYSSLNRAHRPHRTEHLFVLANRDLLTKGLVSGGAFFNTEGIGTPNWIETTVELWEQVLTNHYPKSVDIDALNLKTNNPANSLNTEIYNNALLSVVTETFFDEPGLFITEKTFKPILVGSPQITLTQPGAISYIKQKFNIDLKLPGLDLSYDIETDHRERFVKFHKTLIDWIALPDTVKHRLSTTWDEQLAANRKVIHNTNFRKIIVKDIIASTMEYFTRQIQ